MPEVIARNLPFLATGLGTTLSMAALTALAGTILAVGIALARHLRIPVLSQLLAAYVGFIQGTPVLVVLLICYVAIPTALGVRTTGYAACTAGFSLFLAAYCAEDIRAGLRAVPASLTEAAAALGLSRPKTLGRRSAYWLGACPARRDRAERQSAFPRWRVLLLRVTNRICQAYTRANSGDERCPRYRRRCNSGPCWWSARY